MSGEDLGVPRSEQEADDIIGVLSGRKKPAEVSGRVLAYARAVQKDHFCPPEWRIPQLEQARTDTEPHVG
ncbi:MAG TPA: hypothetical protein VFG99_06005 [Chloroflexia bacterium]|nr:hypothetical protein [Chloroflexia bacterium]